MWTRTTVAISAAWASSGMVRGNLGPTLSSASASIPAALRTSPGSSVSTRTHWGLEQDCCSFLHTLAASRSMVSGLMLSGTRYAKLILCPQDTNLVPWGVISLTALVASSPPHTLTQSASSSIDLIIPVSLDDTLRRYT